MIIALYAVSCLIIAALLVFGLILTRSVVRLWMERSKRNSVLVSKPRWFSGPWRFRCCPSSSCFLSAIPF